MLMGLPTNGPRRGTVVEEELPSSAPVGAGRVQRRPFALPMAALLAVVGIAVYVNSLGNLALFHHPPNPYTDPVLDNTVLRSFPLLPKVFTREFLLSTYGQYRPAGYAFFALLNSIIPPPITNTAYSSHPRSAKRRARASAESGPSAL